MPGGVRHRPGHDRAREDWRNDQIAWLRGEGINNQGRVRSDNVASRQEDGLLFLSMPEIPSTAP